MLVPNLGEMNGERHPQKQGEAPIAPLTNPQPLNLGSIDLIGKPLI